MVVCIVYEASYLKSKQPIPLICFWIIACLSLLSDIVKVVKLNNTCTVTRDSEIELMDFGRLSALTIAIVTSYSYSISYK